MRLERPTFYYLFRARQCHRIRFVEAAARRRPQAVPLVRSQSNEYCGALSPDSRWIAYASDESGVVEIYVRPLPDEGLASGRASQVSYNGGTWPKWSRDGKELFFLDREKYMVSVEVRREPASRPGTPRRLFPTGIHTPDARFDVTADRPTIPNTNRIQWRGRPPHGFSELDQRSPALMSRPEFHVARPVRTSYISRRCFATNSPLTTADI